MSSTKPYLRMKAVLMMYKVFLRYPEALRPAFPKLKEKLEDPDPGVQSAAVNVICELARKNPKNYLSLAPIFFKLMTTSTNNWMLIKIIKLVSVFCLYYKYFYRIVNILSNDILLCLFCKTNKKKSKTKTQFSRLTVYETGIGRKLTQPLIEIIARFFISFLLFVY